jgi:drug/metabolite transporter (DMT)-like permease
MAPSLAVSAHDLVVCLAWGTLVHPLGVSLFVLASRTLPAAEFMLLGMVEIILGPIWAWLAVGEVPSLFTLLGGAIILAAVAAWSAARLRRAEG